MKLLALDASTQWLSVAAGDGVRWHARRELAGHAHSERLLPLARDDLDEAGWKLGALDAIAFGAGPGSFTGVRIACGAAQGLALGAGIPLVPVGTLLAVAQAAWRTHGSTHVLAALDARMSEVYVAAYVREGDTWRTQRAPAVMPPAKIDVPPGAWLAAGDAFTRYPELAARAGLAGVDAECTPDATAIGELAAASLARGEPAVAARDAAPFYVRDRVDGCGARRRRAAAKRPALMASLPKPVVAGVRRSLAADDDRRVGYIAVLEAQRSTRRRGRRRISAIRSPPATTRSSASASTASSRTAS